MPDWLMTLVAPLVKLLDKVPWPSGPRQRREHDRNKFQELPQVLSEDDVDQFFEQAF